MVLENAAGDVPTVFGANSPEAMQTAADPDKFKDVEVAKYVGEAIHCAQGAAVCADSSHAVADTLPTEPGGYHDYPGAVRREVHRARDRRRREHVAQRLPGHRRERGPRRPQRGHLQEPFTHTPGFPGFSPTASQSLAVLADMQEAGIPVTYGYISDTHDKKTRRHRLHLAGQRARPG